MRFMLKAPGEGGPSPQGLVGEGQQLGEQLLPGLRVLDEDRADRAILRCLQDLLDSVGCRIDGFRLAVVVEAKHLWGDRLAHSVPDAYVVVHPDAQLASQLTAPYCQMTGSDFSDRKVMLGWYSSAGVSTSNAGKRSANALKTS